MKRVLHLPESIVHPSPRQLRQFSALLPLVGLAISWMLGYGRTGLLVAGAAGTTVALLGWLLPTALKPVYVTVSLLSYPIGLVVGELVMLAVYIGVLTPIALAFRLMGRDVLERRIDRSAASYWRIKKAPHSARSYLRRW